MPRQTLHQGLLDLVKQIHEQRHEGKVYLGGTTQMLKNPEFNSVNRVRELLQIVEERRLLKDILNSSSFELKIFL